MIYNAKSSCFTYIPIIAETLVVCLYLEYHSLPYNYYLLPNYSIFASLLYFSSHVKNILGLPPGMEQPLPMTGKITSGLKF